MASDCRLRSVPRPRFPNAFRMLFALLAIGVVQERPAAAAPPAATGTPLAGWHFAIPPGWLDFSPGQPLPANLPPDVATLVRSGVYVAMAADVQGAKDGFAANLNALVERHPLLADEAALARYAAAVPSSAEREIQEPEVGVLEKSIVPIGGVPSLRLLIAIHRADGVNLRLLRYVIPGGGITVALTYTATQETYAQYLPIFEASAQATQGAAEAPFLTRTAQGLLGSLLGDMSPEDRERVLTLAGRLGGAAVFLLLVALYQRSRRRRQGALEEGPETEEF